MSQKLYPSAHLLEMFSPLKADEARMLQVMQRVSEMGFYQNFELPSFLNSENRRLVRTLLENNGLTGTTFVTPYIKPLGLALCDTQEERRQEALKLVKYHAELAAECGYLNFGIPSGDDPGDEKRRDAMKAMTASMEELAEFTAKLGINLTIEPLDRYAYKKQLIGPMEESCQWFAPIRKKYPNTYLHWDSAHEALGGINLMESLDLARPFLGQFHLCDAITDPSHPCFGDLHMDCASAPDWNTEGFLTPEVGAEILKKVASFDAPQGMKKMYVSVEVLGHPGNNLWHTEKIAREFLIKSFEVAGLPIG